jgi:hypothetical protein
MSPETNSQTPSFAENCKDWVQTVGIIIAAIWGVYAFVYKEITAPRSAPVNITLDLQLKKVDAGAPQHDLVAVEVKCSAKNPSSREIKLLPSAWIAYGSRIVGVKEDQIDFPHQASATLQDNGGMSPVLRHALREKISMVGTGLLFPDDGLKPGETTARTLVIYVPKNVYNQLDFVAVMPSSEDTKGIKAEWSLNNDEELVHEMYRLDKKGQRLPTQLDENGSYLDKRLWAQKSTAYAAISLGPEN